MNNNKIKIGLLLLGVLQCFNIQSQEAQLNTLNFKTSTELKEFFKYKGDETIIMSGHRGGRVDGFSENSIEGLENVLKQMPAMFEIDPRLTKDSVIYYNLIS